MFAILTYHSIDDSGSVVSVAPKTFAAQMKSLSENGYRGISMREAVAHFNKQGRWPQRCAALTFDDGFANFYEEAMPELARYGFSATVFVISGHMDGRNDWAEPPASLGWRDMLSWKQVRELAALGIEIGAHTRTHPDLRNLSDARLQEEVAGCCAEINDYIGQKVESFAYPFGYLNSSAQDAVARAVRSACTTELRRASDDPLHLLPRVDMYYLQSPRQLPLLVEGKLDGYLTIRRWGRAVKQTLTERRQ